MNQMTEREKKRVANKKKARARRWAAKIASAFKAGMTREEVAQSFGTNVREVDSALRSVLRSI